MYQWAVVWFSNFIIKHVVFQFRIYLICKANNTADRRLYLHTGQLYVHTMIHNHSNLCRKHCLESVLSARRLLLQLVGSPPPKQLKLPVQQLHQLLRLQQHQLPQLHLHQPKNLSDRKMGAREGSSFCSSSRWLFLLPLLTCLLFPVTFAIRLVKLLPITNSTLGMAAEAAARCYCYTFDVSETIETGRDGLLKVKNFYKTFIYD